MATIAPRILHIPHVALTFQCARRAAAASGAPRNVVWINSAERVAAMRIHVALILKQECSVVILTNSAAAVLAARWRLSAVQDISAAPLPMSVVRMAPAAMAIARKPTRASGQAASDWERDHTRRISKPMASREAPKTLRPAVAGE